MFSHYIKLRHHSSTLTRFIQCRHESTLDTNTISLVDKWIEDTTALELKNGPTFSRDQSSLFNWLCSSLPTRSSEQTEFPPKYGMDMPPGLHFALSEPSPPYFENVRNEDGTSPLEFGNVPRPFTRRMWLSGDVRFNSAAKQLQLRPTPKPVLRRKELLKIEKKGFSVGKPKLFITRRLSWTRVKYSPGDIAPITEERTHCFLTPSLVRGNIKEVAGLPSPQFSFEYTPNTNLLFRMSAATGNDHRIHYDADYCRNVEGLRGLVVHGPLTAMLLLEFISKQLPRGRLISRFTYRAVNPLFVNEKCILYGAFTDADKYSAKVWAQSEAGVVGMTADLDTELSLEPFVEII